MELKHNEMVNDKMFLSMSLLYTHITGKCFFYTIGNIQISYDAYGGSLLKPFAQRVPSLGGRGV